MAAATTEVHPPATHRSRTAAVLWLLSLLTAAGLAVDAYVHADLAQSYDPIKATVSQGGLFRAEAAAAALAALLLLVLRRHRYAWLLAFAVAGAGVAAVLVYRYNDVGAIGPLPNMYEPIWYPEKTASAIAEGVAAATALAGLLLTWRRPARGTGRRHRPSRARQ
ncbi:hypothetical protein P3T35_007245 [Kitasatospora sp. GP30]|uniref:hypothetical protein n=1 Tax=Kitasatospora sp. GP30 TaxID=3035084 RepID=UPI000CC5AC52|nr:hypothetical protein [Kitasatospora sp. GP30]MDH6145194.1 hypothetical protein [Kitasatospora sp. GP30]